MKQTLSLETLIGAGVNVHAVDRSGKTPLHVACAAGRGENVGVLIQHGGDPNSLDNQTNTVLHAAIMQPDKHFISRRKSWKIDI